MSNKKVKLDEQKELANSIVEAMGKLSEEDRDSLLRLFINRSLAFEVILNSYNYMGEHPPTTVLEKMGFAGLASVELYKDIRDYEAEKILYGVKVDE